MTDQDFLTPKKHMNAIGNRYIVRTLDVFRLTEVDNEILSMIWYSACPVTMKEISEKTGLSLRYVNLRFHNFKKDGLIIVAGDGFIITEKGKETIGFPKVDEKKARKILRRTLPGNAFYFYSEINQPLDISSDCLKDFYEKIGSVDIKSIEFHMSQGDFESWIHLLGDVELERKIGLIREANLASQDLRRILHASLKARYDELFQSARSLSWMPEQKP